MSTSVVGVHGIWNHGSGTPSARVVALSSRWTEDVRRGLLRPPDIDVHVAFYAHMLRTPARQGPAALADLGVENQDLIPTWASLFDPPAEVAQGRGTEHARRALEWVANRFGLDHGFVRNLITRFLAEVQAYLHDPDSPDRIDPRNLVAQEVRTRRPRIVAHSLGKRRRLRGPLAHPRHPGRLTPDASLAPGHA